MARVGGLELDKDIFPKYATANSARGAREWGVGLNWHLNKSVKASINYINTDFDHGSSVEGDVTHQNEQAFLTRVQLSF